MNTQAEPPGPIGATQRSQASMKAPQLFGPKTAPCIELSSPFALLQMLSSALIQLNVIPMQTLQP
jgi:hypothetical protein